MLFALALIVIGLPILVYSSDLFIEGAKGLAKRAGISPLIIGMVIVGFGTSVPEMLVSALAALEGKPELALGNAYGSNIANIGLILGVAALVRPISVQSGVLRQELPMLLGVSLMAFAHLLDGELSRLDALVMLLLFSAFLGWSLLQGKKKGDSFGLEVEQALPDAPQSLRKSMVQLVAGLGLLMLSSRMIVVGAVQGATALGVSELIIGLTIVAVGTSLPELASSVMAARKGEHDMALGNVLGSNLFNSLAVVGLAGLIEPTPVAAEICSRDLLVMNALTLSLFAICYGFRGPGRVNRVEGGLLLLSYLSYLTWLVIHSS